MREIELQSCVRRAEGLLSTELDGEVVLMSIERGSYYGVADTAQHIWNLLEQPMTVSALCDSLCAQYQIDADTCQRDVFPFLQQLKDEGLLIVE